MVVRDGAISSAICQSPKPVTEISSGMARPSARHSAIAATAMKSLIQISAVGKRSLLMQSRVAFRTARAS
ncbi:hypothetical protein D3C85_1866800 [compost metagenome]